MTKVALPRLWAFASPAFCAGALGLPIVMYLPTFYAEIGLELVTVGVIFMVARMWDVVSDPLMGVFGDRLRTRWGRRRPAMVFAVPVLIASGYVVFNPPGDVSAVQLIVAMILLYAGWTLFTLAHAAWASELSADYHERSRIMSVLEGATLVGTITIVAVPAAMDWLAPGTGFATKMAWMSGFILVPLPVLVWLALRSVPEPAAKQNASVDWREGARALVANKALRRLLIADLLGGVQGGVNGSLHLFFATHALEMPQYASLFIVVIFISSLALIPLWLKLSYRTSKHSTLIVGVLVNGFFSFLVLWVPPGNIYFALAVFAGIGSFLAARGMMMRSIMADIIDYDTVATGRERNALFYALLSMTAKLGLALAVGVFVCGARPGRF